MKSIFSKNTLCVVIALAYWSNVSAQSEPTVQNTTTTYDYDSVGNVTQITDPLGQVTNTFYDGLNRLIQLQQPAPVTGGSRPVINYGFDGLNQITSITDPRNLSTTYTIDGLGNSTVLSSPDTGSTSRTYDAAGNIIATTDARGMVITYTYDVLNRLTKITYSSDTATQFEYDGGISGSANNIGRLTKITDASGATTFQYDAFGRLLSKTQMITAGVSTVNLTSTYAYGTTGNTLGKLVSVTYPSGNRIDYTYNDAGQIHSLTLIAQGSNATLPLMGNINYAPFGLAQSWEWGGDNGVGANSYIRTFDLDGRVTSYPLGNATQGGLIRTVNYDAASRVISYVHTTAATNATAPSFDQSFTYDNLSRLITATTSSSTSGYIYDASGNRTQVRYGTSNYNYVVDTGSNRLAVAPGPSFTQSYNYDAAGNILTNGSIIFSYNDQGRPIRTVSANFGEVRYIYDGFGQRVAKTASSTVLPTGANFYSYDEDGKIIGEYDASGRALQETVYLGTMPVAVLTPTSPLGTNVFYIYTDQINTPRVITSAATNSIVWRWDMADPFGASDPNESINGTDTFVYNPRMPGQLFDKETGHFYNYFRDYDPALGRYVESDPVGLKGGINTYAYVLNQPGRFSDSAGLQAMASPFGPLPLPPVFMRGTPANDAFIKSTNRMLKAIRNFCANVGNDNADDTGGGDTRTGDKDPSTPTGQRGSPMDVPKGTNEPANIGGRDYSGHALDQSQGRGATPTVVEDTITNGTSRPDKNFPDTRTEHTSQDGRVQVITDKDSGRVITIIVK